MALLTYNGVCLPYPFFTDCKQEAIGDDLSNTDWTGIKFDIVVQTIINTSYLNVIDPTLVGIATNPTDIMSAIRTKLLARRKRLSLKQNGVELIPQPQSQNGVPISGTVDSRNGPIPIACDISHVAMTAFLVTYRITAQYWQNTKVQAAGSNPLVLNNIASNVLYNRWSETVDIDENQYSTITRDGKYMIRSDTIDGLTADQLRFEMTTLAARRGFLRVASHYTVSPDGLAIQYKITDREQFKMPPSPALKADGYYSEIAQGLAQVRFGDVMIRLEGGAQTDQVALIACALRICAKKLHLRNALADGTQTNFGKLSHFSLKCGMYSNWVECHMQAQLAPVARVRIGGITGGVVGVGSASLGVAPTIGGVIAGLKITDFPITPGSTDINEYVPTYRLRGSANLLLQAAAYYDPNLQAQLNPVTGNMSAGVQPGQAGIF
jgi:hypothetical protein